MGRCPSFSVHLPLGPGSAMFLSAPRLPPSAGALFVAEGLRREAEEVDL